MMRLDASNIFLPTLTIHWLLSTIKLSNTATNMVIFELFGNLMYNFVNHYKCRFQGQNMTLYCLDIHGQSM